MSKPLPVRHDLKRPKYGTSPKDQRTCDGIVFDSKKEMRRYQYLKLEKKAGNVLTFLRQTPFHLPGDSRYVCDFTVFWSDGRVTFEDVKGVRTEQYKLKKRQVEEIYAPITILEI